MKIFLTIPGHLNTVPMNNYVFETLKSMGHSVKLFNYGVHSLYPRFLKKLSKERFLSYLDKRLIPSIRKFKLDVFLTIFGFDHKKMVIEQIKSIGIVAVCWWLNDPPQFKRSILHASYYDYYFTNSKGSLNDYYREGIKNVFYLPVGCFPSGHKKLINIDKKYDICFAGDWGPEREGVLNSLALAFNLCILGPWKKKKLKRRSVLINRIVNDRCFSPEEMVNVFNQSKIVLNIHAWFGKWNFGINPRVFEANGCGAFQISDYKEEIPELYEPEREIVLYRSIAELREKLSFFLTRDKEMQDIAEKGYLRTINYHTYKHRLKEMFYICRLE